MGLLCHEKQNPLEGDNEHDYTCKWETNPSKNISLLDKQKT